MARRKTLMGGIGGRQPELIRPWATGLAVTSLAGIHHLCLCTWIWRPPLWELKFTNRMCPDPKHGGPAR